MSDDRFTPEWVEKTRAEWRTEPLENDAIEVYRINYDIPSWSAYRPPSGKKPMTDAPQISEFTETQCKDAQTEIQNIIKGLSDSMTA